MHVVSTSMHEFSISLILNSYGIKVPWFWECLKINICFSKFIILSHTIFFDFRSATINASSTLAPCPTVRSITLQYLAFLAVFIVCMVLVMTSFIFSIISFCCLRECISEVRYTDRDTNIAMYKLSYSVDLYPVPSGYFHKPLSWRTSHIFIYYSRYVTGNMWYTSST